jgi:nitrous oxide reductase
MNRNDFMRRRALILGAGALGLASTLAARAQSESPAAKQSKSDAQYQDKPHSGQLCGICAYFAAPSSCQKVDGEIRPTGWCKNFERKS